MDPVSLLARLAARLKPCPLPPPPPRRNRAKKRQQALEQKLLTAQRAARTSPSSSFNYLHPAYGIAYTPLLNIKTPTPPGDGAWWCCRCRHEHTLIHLRGAYPFGFLRCSRCRHVLCGSCQSTQVLGPLAATMIVAAAMNGIGAVAVPVFARKEEVPYGVVCVGCGLSHRGRRDRHFGYVEGWMGVMFEGVVCVCGTVVGEEWFCFRVGSNEDWRNDQVRCYGRVLEERVRRVAE